MVADVKSMSVIAPVQLLFGQPASAAVGWSGGSVVTLNARLPFLISLAGNDWLPVTVTSPGFWPGAWVPPWLVHVVVGSAVAVSVIRTSPLPRPASEPLAFNTRPWSAKTGDPFLKCTLTACATDAVSASATSAETTIDVRLIDGPPCRSLVEQWRSARRTRRPGRRTSLGS